MVGRSKELQAVGDYLDEIQYAALQIQNGDNIDDQYVKITGYVIEIRKRLLPKLTIAQEREAFDNG